MKAVVYTWIIINDEPKKAYVRHSNMLTNDISKALQMPLQEAHAYAKKLTAVGVFSNVTILEE